MATMLTVSLSIRKTRSASVRMQVMLSLVIMTPLGSPVVPDV